MAKSAIPDDLKGVLKECDINTIFFYFENEFHLSKKWRLDFHSDYLRSGKVVNEVDFFCKYLNTHIEPVLKQLLRREDNVTLAAIRYILRDRLQPPNGKMYVNRK